MTLASLTIKKKMVPVLHICTAAWLPCATWARDQCSPDFSHLRVSFKRFFFKLFFIVLLQNRWGKKNQPCPESMNLQYFSILPSRSKREYGLANIHSSQHHAANMMNVIGGSAYDNKEVNEKSQAGSCFVRNRINPYICQQGETNIRKERKGTVKKKKRYSKKGEQNYRS